MNMKRIPVLWVAFAGILLILSACRISAYRSSNKMYKRQSKELSRLLREYPVRDSAGLPYADEWVGTTNFSIRRPNIVVIHHTAQHSDEQTLKTFTTKRTQVSAHYVIAEDGTVYHMLNDLLRAHHAGVSKWGSQTDLNSSSIGIEIDNDGYEAFTELQIQSLLQLLARLKQAYHIPTSNFVGHADIAPGRKVDPNRHFPWQRLADSGFGYWYDTTGIKVQAGFEPMQALRLIGYNTSNEKAAIQSYRLHFTPTDSSATLNKTDLKILSSLIQRYR